MNLLRKYYDKDSIGGGIPDEVKQKIADKALEECSEPKFEGGIRINKDQRLGFIKGGLYGYSLATEKLKERDEEISRLKEDNERLRGELSELYDVVFKGENVFKSLDKAHEVLNKPNITIVQSKNK